MSSQEAKYLWNGYFGPKMFIHASVPTVKMEAEEFPKYGGPYIIILTIGTPKMIPLLIGTQRLRN